MWLDQGRKSYHCPPRKTEFGASRYSIISRPHERFGCKFFENILNTVYKYRLGVHSFAEVSTKCSLRLILHQPLNPKRMNCTLKLILLYSLLPGNELSILFCLCTAVLRCADSQRREVVGVGGRVRQRVSVQYTSASVQRLHAALTVPVR